MAVLASLIAALESRFAGREHFLAVAQPGLGDDAAESSPICGIAVDDQASEVLLLCSLSKDTSSQLTLGTLLEALRELSAKRQGYELELTLKEEQPPEHGDRSLLRVDFPVVGLSINETVKTLSFHWTS